MRLLVVALSLGGLVVGSIAVAAVAYYLSPAEQCREHVLRQEYVAALPACRQSAEGGDAQGMATMGVLELGGYGLKPDYDNAMWWDQRAAYLGSADAMAEIGFMFASSLGATKNTTEAYIGSVRRQTLEIRQGCTCSVRRMGTERTALYRTRLWHFSGT